jgi:SCP-2 sterol transfer family protein
VGTGAARRRPPASPSERFFDDLGAVGHDVRLEKMDGTVRFELANGRRRNVWTVRVVHGDVSVSRLPAAEPARAACTVRSTHAVFDELLGGRSNAFAAVLRGDVTFEGDPQLAMQFMRVFPGPSGARHPREQAAEALAAGSRS